MTPSELIARAFDSPADSAERILYAVAAFDALVEDDIVLVGGAALVSHTGVGRLTDIDVVGVLGATDEQRLEEAGFVREGRHWVYEADEGALAVELPGSSLTREETYERIQIGGATVRIISVTDLMMDRLIQATDGTDVTRDEAYELAVAAAERIDWDAIASRADKLAEESGFLGALPGLVVELRPDP